ncbi:hypothetical protein GOP47_0016405 [Adiantum capillus-veneris]|uniref:RRM domain-containing protein n=1 Tax=Adiantum capillus-veneris TaxID=13818 RepID=A0A9D4UHL9_ADICA|nr:hypothetical protein GOP47_0016405 [Adiantum capillus-veneris]
MVDKTADVFSNIFGTQTQELSLFSNNAFRRPKHTRSVVGLSSFATIPPSPASKEGAPGPVKEEGKKTKKKEQVSLELLSSHDGDNQPLAGKKHSVVGAFTADEFRAKNVKGLHASPAAVLKRKQQIHSKEPVENHVALANAESGIKHGKRAYQDVLEQQKPTKRQKIRRKGGPDALIPTQHSKSPEGGSERAKPRTKREKDDSSPDAKSVKKLRKLEDNLEVRYEKKLRGTDGISNEESGLTSKGQEEEKSLDRREGVVTAKRKRIGGDGQVVDATAPRTFDAEEKLKRTIFVGNLPLTTKTKALNQEFSIYGPVESVRLRSVPLLDTKIPRKGAIITGQINEAVNSQHAYVVFEEAAFANAALAHNMKEFCGNHLRVDAAYAPHQTLNGKFAVQYDPKRSIFVGNIPFDVKDEELYQTFGAGKSPEMDIEAVRVVRDHQTSACKGIAYVMFKTTAGALSFLSTKRQVKLRDRILRICHVRISQANKQNQPSRWERPRRASDLDRSQSHRKRAKLSASYEGMRATKESVHSGQEKRQGAGSQQLKRSARKKGSTGSAIAVGTKRKRMEKHQRGISRSKKIRRT